ncbi:RNA polymerase sigma factor SigZ [Nonomuraea soli]|uniref:RNA polymerase sigma factor SigZ n=1 Tax=Nonomuraea soli TaxID=1032476 RepID=A0A7W0CUS6_9ACTN|nr:RNA polymerase sigma factor SigZ [Nonomuraea soli]MBA2897627.1 RNA polymerase sigma-70 factor (ECF subfamily) [Nonomuraea soli]
MPPIDDGFRERLLAFISRRVERPQDAEDLLQEVYLKIARSAEGLRDRGRLEAWIYQIARNVITDHYRSAARAHQAHARKALDPTFTPEAADEDELLALTACLAPMVARLPAAYREAIELVEYGGLTQAEAAAKAGISVSGMKSRVQRGRTRLHEMLTACCQIALDTRTVTPRTACGCT